MKLFVCVVFAVTVVPSCTLTGLVEQPVHVMLPL
jgi:hypothetical protein